MTRHGSWFPSQVAHFGESLGIWIVTWGLAMYSLGLGPLGAGWCAAWTTLCANSLAEGKSIGNRMRRTGRGLFDEVNAGDWIDYAAHTLGWAVPILVMYAVVLIFNGATL